MKTDLPQKINLSVKNQTRCNPPLLLGFNGKIKLSVFSKKSPFSSSLIFRKSQNFRRLKSSKIKGLRLKNQTVCYNQTGRLNTTAHIGRFFKVLYSLILSLWTKKRSNRDLNPRCRLDPHNTLAGCRLQPLGHYSVFYLACAFLRLYAYCIINIYFRKYLFIYIYKAFQLLLTLNLSDYL